MNRSLEGREGSQQQIKAAFDACHRKVIWTYETIVATDFLPRISAEATLDRVAPGALHAYVRGAVPNAVLPTAQGVHTYIYRCQPGTHDNEVIRIPHEFAVAAFRLGHTLVRDEYQLHGKVVDSSGNVLTGKPRPIFASADQPSSVGLAGDNPLAPQDVIDWRLFFDVEGTTAQATRPLDTMISDKLFSLPVSAIPPGTGPDGKDTSTERNLPRRNIFRASQPTTTLTGSVGLANGEEAMAYARQRILGMPDATGKVREVIAKHLIAGGFDPSDMSRKFPLWLYILAEAEGTQDSQRLGELGSHIVDEFLLGSLKCDADSVLHTRPEELRGWGPTETIARTGRYTMPSLISYLQNNAVVDGARIHLIGN